MPLTCRQLWRSMPPHWPHTACQPRPPCSPSLWTLLSSKGMDPRWGAPPFQCIHTAHHSLSTMVSQNVVLI